MYTDPNGINSNLTKANINNGSKIKPVIRLLKNWNISKAYRHYESYGLETNFSIRILILFLYIV